MSRFGNVCMIVRARLEGRAKILQTAFAAGELTIYDNSDRLT